MPLYRCNACGLEGRTRELDGECPQDAVACRVEPVEGICESCTEPGIGFTDDGEFLCGDCLFEAMTEAMFGEQP